MEIKKALSFIASTGLFLTSCGLPTPGEDTSKAIPSPTPLAANPKLREDAKHTLPLVAESQTTADNYFLKYEGAKFDIRNSAQKNGSSPVSGTIRVELETKSLKDAFEAKLPLLLERQVGSLKYSVTFVTSVYNEGQLLEVNPFPRFQIEDPLRGNKDSCQIPGQMQRLSRHSVLAFWASIKNGNFVKTNGSCAPVDKAEKERIIKPISVQGEIDRNTTPQSLIRVTAALKGLSPRATYEAVSMTTVRADVTDLASMLTLDLSAAEIDAPLKRKFFGTVFAARAGQLKDRVNFAKLKGTPLQESSIYEQIEHDMLRSQTIHGLPINIGSN